MKIIHAIVILSLVFFSANFIVADDDKDKKEATPEARLQAAKEAMSTHTNIALIYVKGLVCPSCGIGVSKNLSRMKGVDKKRFKRGIEMDVKTQLVKIALTGKTELEKADILERVDDAGFVAIEEYKLHDGHLDAHRFGTGASIEVIHHLKK
jgi:copper chaperone CopZ